ncbi:unnamed protein product [Musa textilis]
MQGFSLLRFLYVVVSLDFSSSCDLLSRSLFVGCFQVAKEDRCDVFFVSILVCVWCFQVAKEDRCDVFFVSILVCVLFV